jgi:hypothetical protein
MSFKDARSKFVNGPLTLIFRAYLQCCWNIFTIDRQPIAVQRQLIIRLSVNVVAQPLGFSKMQRQNSLMLSWHSFWGWGNRRVMFVFHYNVEKEIQFGRMWKYTLLIAECVRQEIVHAGLMLTLIALKQPLYSQWLYPTGHILDIGIPYCICMKYHLHAGDLLNLNIWSTSIQGSWVRDDVALSHSCACGRQFTACWSFH